MSIDKAIEELFQSEEFKLAAKKKSTLRVMILRFNNGELKSGAKTELLIQFGYTITAEKKVKKKK